MNRLFEFGRSIYVVVLFIVLEIIAINFYAHSTLYTQAKLLSYSNRVVGGAQGVLGGINNYFSLRQKNDILLSRVEELEGELSLYRHLRSDSLLRARSVVESAAIQDSPYSYTRARVVTNTINRVENYITLNRGELDGIRRNMAVVSPAGEMVGYVVRCSERYCVVASILNAKFKTSGKITGQEYMGAIFWEGRSRYQVEMSELSKYASLSIGDEVTSTGNSQIFPEGVKIGHIASYELNPAATAYNLTIDLACDISSLSEVLIIGNNNYDEIEMLQNEIK